MAGYIRLKHISLTLFINLFQEWRLLTILPWNWSYVLNNTFKLCNLLAWIKRWCNLLFGSSKHMLHYLEKRKSFHDVKNSWVKPILETILQKHCNPQTSELPTTNQSPLHLPCLLICIFASTLPISIPHFLKYIPNLMVPQKNIFISDDEVWTLTYFSSLHFGAFNAEIKFNEKWFDHFNIFFKIVNIGIIYIGIKKNLYIAEETS